MGEGACEIWIQKSLRHVNRRVDAIKQSTSLLAQNRAEMIRQGQQKKKKRKGEQGPTISKFMIPGGCYKQPETDTFIDQSVSSPITMQFYTGWGTTKMDKRKV